LAHHWVFAVPGSFFESPPEQLSHFRTRLLQGNAGLQPRDQL